MVIILIATALVMAVTVVLAALLIVAERRLVDYGICTIDVNNGSREIETEGGGTLLNTLMDHEIFIPSACGGKGTCAFCKVRILEGGDPLSPTEAPLLTDEEIANDMRISCQCKVRRDLNIQIPEHLLEVKEYTGRVETMEDLTHDIKLVRIALTEPETISFVPGQYIQLRAPAYEGSPEPVYRAYSVASPPSEATHIELIIRLVPGGTCTTYVFEHLAEGDEVILNGPYGEFRLSETNRPMVWIAGGSGMAPFRSILMTMDEQDATRETTYFFGAVQKRDMFFLDQLRRFDEEHDWFTYVPALSGPAEEDRWDGETGLITEVVDRHVEEGTNAEGYLCGSPGMIDASIEVLEAKGIGEERIFYDKFA